MTEENAIKGFFVKYKKWFIALIGVQLIPVVLLVALFGGGAIYVYMNNDTNFHAYKSDIISGYHAGHSDGRRDEVKTERGGFFTPWERYKSATRSLQERADLEKQEYLAQFAEPARGVELAIIDVGNLKLPLQIELDKRFKNDKEFYTDYNAKNPEVKGSEITGSVTSLWFEYKKETESFKKRVLREKQEYLAQFPASERGMKLAEMRSQNIKLPLQLELRKRFKTGLSFYADYVKKQVKREDFKSDQEYKDELESVAWKVGYSCGYRKGLQGISVRYGHETF